MKYQNIGSELKKGKIIIYPTDTVYGVGGILEEEVLKNIYKVKSRKFNSPLIALISNPQMIEKIAVIEEEKKEKVEKLIEKFWPGGLTIILRKKESVPNIMVSNGETVGVRIPNHQVAIEIIESAGGVLATTSANISGEATPGSFEEISDEIKKRVDIIIDDGKCPLGEASTIIDMSKEKINILREGSISQKDIENIIGKI